MTSLVVALVMVVAVSVSLFLSIGLNLETVYSQEPGSSQEALNKFIEDTDRLGAIVGNITTMEDLDRMKACGVDNGTAPDKVMQCWNSTK